MAIPSYCPKECIVVVIIVVLVLIVVVVLIVVSILVVLVVVMSIIITTMIVVISIIIAAIPTIVINSDASNNGGISQSARHTPNPKLRRAALGARRQERDAKKWAMWASQGWICTRWQQQQIMLLETGELAKQVRSANAAYGFGRGAEEALTREQAMTLEVFTNQVLNEYMK